VSPSLFPSTPYPNPVELFFASIYWTLLCEAELIVVLGSWRRLQRFLISRMTNVPGRFFAWRLVRATKR
jgi:hypothetical protein